MDSAGRRAAAKRLLTRYIRGSFQGAGLGWDSDKVADVEAIIDLIFDEIAEQRKATDRLRKQAIARAEEMHDEIDAMRTRGPSWES